MAESAKKDITAYSLYSKQAKERTKVNPLENIYPKLPEKNIKLFMLIHHGIMGERCNMTKPQLKMEM